MPSLATGPRAVHRIRVAGLERALPVFEVAPGVSIAVFNMLGDPELVEAVACEMVPLLPDRVHVLVTAEAKSIPLVHALARRCGLPAVVLRKSYKSYMGATIQARTHSITTGATQTLHMDESDIVAVRGRNVVLVDDVVSTGSTLEGMREIVAAAGGLVVRVLAVFTEGAAEGRSDVVALGHLPVFRAPPA